MSLPAEQPREAHPPAPVLFTTPRAQNTDERRGAAILLVAGANLTLVQYFAMKEFASLVGSNEIVVLLVASAYFLGLSLGYLVADRLGERTLLVLGVSTLLLHATLPFSARWVAGTLARFNLAGNVPPFAFLLVLFGISPFYAVFLPRLVDSLAGRVSLARLYATEIAGGLLGLVLVLLLGTAGIRWLLGAHLAGIAGILLLSAGNDWRWMLWTLAVPLGFLGRFGDWNYASLEYLYRHSFGFRDPFVLISEFSPYQRVDLVQEGHNQTTSKRFLYLNGVLFYGNTTLNQHNLFVSILPNALPRESKPRTLVVGGGSLDSARYVTPRAASLHVVELDEAVPRITRRYIQDERGNFPEGFELVIDDGKHFLGTWEGEPFDVISIDVPIPSHVQTAVLHSERFFRLAKSRLAPGGMMAISLSGELTRGNPDGRDWTDADLPNRIAAGLFATFEHVVVLESGKRRAFAWASDDPIAIDQPGLDAALQSFLSETGTTEFFGTPTVTILDPAVVAERAAGFEPIGEADLQIVLRLSLEKLYYDYYEP